MRKYIAFRFDDYYPAGGLGDISGDFESVDEAVAHLTEKGYIDNAYIVDRDTWQEIEVDYRTETGRSQKDASYFLEQKNSVC